MTFLGYALPPWLPVTLFWSLFGLCAILVTVFGCWLMIMSIEAGERRRRKRRD